MIIKYSDKQIELTTDEARELRDQLNIVLGKTNSEKWMKFQENTVHHYHHHFTIQNPTYQVPYYNPGIICQNIC